MQNQKEKKSTYFLCTMAKNVHYHSKREEWRNSGKYRTKVRLKLKTAIFKPCSSMPDDNGLRGSSLPALLTATRFSLGLAPHHECISPWQTSQNSSTSIILKPLMPSRLHFHNFTQWPLLAFMKELPCNMAGLSTFG